MEILNTFGIQPVLLLAQIINFAILVFILNKFAYKPILKVLDARKQRISDSIKNASDIEAKLAAVSVEVEELLKKANLESKNIISEARNISDQIVSDAGEKASHEATAVLAKATARIEAEHTKMLTDVKSEMSELISASLKQILSDTLDATTQKTLIEKAIKKL